MSREFNHVDACSQSSVRLCCAGTTLVELLVAMLLACSLLLAFVQGVLSMQRSTASQQHEVKATENARVALLILKRQLQQAGIVYPLVIHSSRHSALRGRLFPETDAFTAGSVIAGSRGVSRNRFKPDSDVVSLRFRVASPANDKDCRNRGGAIGELMSMAFYVDPDGIFRCYSEGRGYEIVRGVEDMQVLFHIRYDGTEALYTEQQIEASPDREALWQAVVAVDIALLVRTQGIAHSELQRGVKYRMLDRHSEEFDDGRLRRVLYLSVAVRNAAV